jgi:hypothetical protein
LLRLELCRTLHFYVQGFQFLSSLSLGHAVTYVFSCKPTHSLSVRGKLCNLIFALSRDCSAPTVALSRGTIIRISSFIRATAHLPRAGCRWFGLGCGGFNHRFFWRRFVLPLQEEAQNLVRIFVRRWARCVWFEQTGRVSRVKLLGSRHACGGTECLVGDKRLVLGRAMLAPSASDTLLTP